MTNRTVLEQAYKGFALLDAKADQWAEEVHLPDLISDAIEPLRQGNDEIQRKVATERIYLLVRQAFQEGALAGVEGIENERDRLRALGLE